MITFKPRVGTIKTGQTTSGLTAISPKIKFIIRKERERERERERDEGGRGRDKLGWRQSLFLGTMLMWEDM